MNMCRLISRLFTAGVCLLALGFQFGCATAPSSSALDGAISEKSATDISVDTTFRRGDKITIEFADNPGIVPQWPQTIREDGTITLPLLPSGQTVVAAGKKKGELETAIHDLYVPKILRRLTVNVRSDQRSYFVTGEVKTPGQKEHTGLITVMKAVGTAGDFTDYADKKHIDLIRGDGTKIIVNGVKALKDPAKYDKPVYPGDTVRVHRRYW
jgi:protein involved in polysaccharide export with SLBB domain